MSETVGVERTALGAALSSSTSTGTSTSANARRLIGAVNVIEAVIAFSWLVWAYGLAEHLVAAQEVATKGTLATRAIGWPALHVDVTLNMSLLIVGAAAGAVGSIVHQGVAYARARQEHLKCDHVLCYVLRPVWSALLGAVAVISVNTGLISIGDQTTSTAGVAVLVTTGALAGLYTDQTLKRLRLPVGGTPAPKSKTAGD